MATQHAGQITGVSFRWLISRSRPPRHGILEPESHISSNEAPALATRNITELSLYHSNPRRGDVDRLCESLLIHGQYRPIVVNTGTHTGRPDEVLAGNHLLLAIRELATATPDDPRWAHLKPSKLRKLLPGARRYWLPGDDYWTTILVHEIDVDDQEAARIVAVDNRTADLGDYDDTVLLELLRTLPDLDGTGYTTTDLEALADIVAGAPDLDDLADEVGDPTDDDTLAALSLKVEPQLKQAWIKHRKDFSDDSAAFSTLLGTA
jgi:hypothetical protein